MRPTVARLRATTNPDKAEQKLIKDLGPHAAAPGFIYLVDSDTQEIIEPAFFYLYSKHGQDAKQVEEDVEPSVASNRAAAYELAEWFRFLNFVKRDWTKAGHELFSLFTHVAATRLSNHTGRKLEASSVSHKLSTIYGFYTWANAALSMNVRWDSATIRKIYKRKAAKRRDVGDDQIRPFSPKEMRKLLAALGPLPTERSKESLIPCRNRLLFETGLLTGMRGEEICFLREKAIRGLKPDPDRPDETQPLRIKVTKGRKYRWIALPNSLIIEIHNYIRGERREAVAKRLAAGKADDGRLFVNEADHPKAGAPLTTQSIHRTTHALMLRLNFSEPATRKRNGRTVRYDRTTHSFHDTRHSYAVNLYISQRNAGDPKPWETVQHMLGHEDWATTEKYYTRSVGVFETQIGIALKRYWEAP